MDAATLLRAEVEAELRSRGAQGLHPQAVAGLRVALTRVAVRKRCTSFATVLKRPSIRDH